MSCCCVMSPCVGFLFFFFNATSTTDIYTLSLHDALPISCNLASLNLLKFYDAKTARFDVDSFRHATRLWTLILRSEEHTSELQSRLHLVCRLLLEKKKNNHNIRITTHQNCKADRHI